MLRRTSMLAVGLMLVGASAVPAFAARPADPGKPAKPKPVKSSTFRGTSADDTWSGTDKRDKAWGRGGKDSLAGLAGNDRLWGGEGDDSLDGGAGDDRIWTGTGADTASGGAGNDRIFAAADDDAIDNITCGDGTDRVVLRHNDIAASDCESVTRVGEAPAPAPAT